MALGRQVHHKVRVGLAHRGGGGLGIGEIHPQELVAVLPIGSKAPRTELRQHPLDAGEITGVTAFVEVEHQRVALPQQAANHRPADEAGAAGHKNALAAGEQGLDVGRW